MSQRRKKKKIKGKPAKLKPLLEGKDRHGNVKEISQTFLHDKDHTVTQGGHEVYQIQTKEYQELITRTYEYLKEGVRAEEILKTFIIEDDQMNESKFTKILTYAYDYAENELHKDREYVFQLHMQRYEDLYRESLIMHDSQHRPLDPERHTPTMARKYMTAIKALKSKEDLLGLHDKTVVLEFNDNKAVIMEQETLRGGSNVVNGYEPDKLNNEELLKLLNLIKKTRTVPIEGIQRVAIKQTKFEISIDNKVVTSQVTTQIDNLETKVQFEDMPSNVVSKFKDVTKIEEAEVVEQINIVSDIPEEIKELPKLTIDDVKDKVKEQALEQLRKRLKRSR